MHYGTINELSVQYLLIVSMKKQTLFQVIFCLIITLCYGCLESKKNKISNKKPTPKLIVRDYLHLNNGRPAGIIRVECKDCKLIYIIDNEKEEFDIKNGSIDKFFYPKKNAVLSSSIKSNLNQMIRIIVFDPNGNIVHNELSSFKANSLNQNEYKVSFIQKPTSIMIKTFAKN